MTYYVKETADLVKRYNDLKERVIARKTEFKALCDFIEYKTEWLTAPASTRFHLSKKHGLLEHSCNVAETMLKMKNVLAPKISDESCVVNAANSRLQQGGGVCGATINHE